MDNWKSLLKADPTNWLLEKENPSVRYLTLTEILDKTEIDPEVMKAKNEIILIGAVPEILAEQRTEGYARAHPSFLTFCLRGTAKM